MNELSQYQQILQATAEKLVKDSYNVQGLKCSYSVQVQVMSEYDISVLAGYPPSIVISTNFLHSGIFEEDDRKRKKNISKIRALISRAVSYLPRQQRTLAIQPIAEILAVKEGMRKFGKSMFPERFFFRIPDKDLFISRHITITMSEKNTGHSVTVQGYNEDELLSQARARLTNLVAASDYAEKMKKNEELNNMEIKPKAIHLKEHETNNEY